MWIEAHMSLHDDEDPPVVVDYGSQVTKTGKVIVGIMVAPVEFSRQGVVVTGDPRAVVDTLARMLHVAQEEAVRLTGDESYRSVVSTITSVA